MANVGTVPGDERLPEAIAGTMATEFAAVYRWRVGDFNEIVAGFAQPLTRPQLLGRMATAPPALIPLAPPPDRVRRQPPLADPLTDDRAPVEWLTDQMIVRYAAQGSDG